MKCCHRFRCNAGLLVAGLITAGALGQFGITAFTKADEPAKKEEVRFDEEVRELFFAGFNGDENSIQKGIDVCEQVLKKEPKHAEAMVWLGSGQVYLAGKSFGKGSVTEGMKYWQVGLQNMDKAAELEPNNIGVLIPRAAVLLPASRGLPAAIRKPVLEGVLKNFENVYEQQKDSLSSIGEHPLGELRMGMADVLRMLGKEEQSRVHLEAVQKELPDSEYSKEAAKWLVAKPSEKLAHNCIGCHSK